MIARVISPAGVAARAGNWIAPLEDKFHVPLFLNCYGRLPRKAANPLLH